MHTDARKYQSYLLRLWREETAEGWRCSLQNTRTCQTYYFACLQDLYQFLSIQTEEEPMEPDWLGSYGAQNGASRHNVVLGKDEENR